MNDLREMFPKIKWQWTADHPKGGRFDPFHVELVGKYGTVFLHTADGTLLQAHLSSKIIGKRVAAMGPVRTHQIGADEMTVIFPTVDAGPVMDALKMRKKRTGGGNVEALKKAREKKVAP
jgi:hypothetical protein